MKETDKLLLQSITAQKLAYDMMKGIETEKDAECIGLLLAISVVSKRLAVNLQKFENN